MSRGVVPISPRQIDPLSWITGSTVPLIFAVLTVVFAVRAAVVDIGVTNPWLQGSAACFFVTGQMILFLASIGLRRTIGLRSASLACALGVVATILSALGYSGRTFAIEQWWAPLALGLVFGALGPYLSPSRILLVGGIATLLVVPPSTMLLASSEHHWGPVSLVVLVATAPLAGVLLAAALSAHVVRRMRALLEARSQNVIVARPPLDEESERAERARLVELTAQAVPFLEGVIETGRVSDADRAIAGQLARRLRDDLVTQASASWLERLDTGSRLVIVDPDERADALRPSQRTALREVLRTLLTAERLRASSVLVELRAAEDGGTAVGISMDADLPEGRRMMFLAPAILTLETAADSVDLLAEEMLRLQLRFGPARSAPPAAARRRRADDA